MKKNILFVMPSLSAGGGEKSLVNLLSQIDYDSYNVDLFLFHKAGLFINSIPKEVNILELPANYRKFKQEVHESIRLFLKAGQFNLACFRLMFTLINRVIKNSTKAEQTAWKYVSPSFDNLEKEYDVAVGYLEKSSIYFVVDKVNSKKKIGWIHTNYSNSGMDYHYDNPFFKQLDYIVTVSEECANSLRETFMHLKDNVRVIYNIVSPRIIKSLSNIEINYDIINRKNHINIITIARLSHEKGIDIAIDACKLLIEKGHKVNWCVLGEGNEREQLEGLIERSGLTNNFKLLGTKENPYPYIRNADIYIQPSRYEGKSIAIDEAKILHMPIIVTNFKTAKDQINNGENGLIVDLNPQAIVAGVEKLSQDISFKEKIINNLSKEKLGTEEEINKLYEIL
ncbi:glycosyltransferase [Priestia aryabhattai]|uniref:glycosyltransferase n=1 Tax=Priestia aryabhattai TaxID=412384 RepID=UPI003D29D287